MLAQPIRVLGGGYQATGHYAAVSVKQMSTCSEPSMRKFSYM